MARPSLQRVSWEVRRAWHRLLRGIGPQGLAALMAFGLLTCAASLRFEQRARWAHALDMPRTGPEVTDTTSARDTARIRLQAFDAILLPHEDIGVALRQLLALADANGLVLTRGAYQAQVDPQGGYLRYRMAFPVSGRSEAVHRFMMAALSRQRSLVLESVQFKRDGDDSADVEARIQWALLTRAAASDRVVRGAGP